MKCKKIVVTRPLQQGVAFVETVVGTAFAQGMTAYGSDRFIVAPMLEILPLPFRWPDVDRYDGLVITSVNALEPLRSDHEGKETKLGQAAALPLYVVGRKTADKAKNMGFRGEARVAATAQDLQTILNEMWRAPGSARLLYLRGRDITYDFRAQVPDTYRIEDLIVYDAKTVTEMPDDLLDALKNEAIGAVTFFSKRSARNFVELAQEMGLTYQLKNVKALCISTAVLECVRPFWKGPLLNAETPDAKGMEALIYQECRT